MRHFIYIARTFFRTTALAIRRLLHGPHDQPLSTAPRPRARRPHLSPRDRKALRRAERILDSVDHVRVTAAQVVEALRGGQGLPRPLVIDVLAPQTLRLRRHVRSLARDRRDTQREPPHPGPLPQAGEGDGRPQTSTADDGEHRHEYTPEPMPRFPLCVPLPHDWYDDPNYKINPFAVASAKNEDGLSPQIGTIGRCTRALEKIAVNYNGCFAHGFFAPPNGGKTYIRGVYIENATQPTPYLNTLPAPLCAISQHYEDGGSCVPDLLESYRPNQNPKEVLPLMRFYGSLPQGMGDLISFTLKDYVKARRQRFPYIPILPLVWAPWDLGITGLKALMAFTPKDETLYGAQFEQMIRSLPEKFTIADIAKGLKTFAFHDKKMRKLLKARFALALPYLDDLAPPMRSHIKPGRTIVIDIHSKWLPPDKAMRLFAAMNYVLVMAGDRDELPCNLLLCFDEVHKFCKNPTVKAQIEYFLRERRHLRVSLMLMSQEPTSVPKVLIGLLDGVGVFRTEAKSWLLHLGSEIAAFQGKKIEDFLSLGTAQMLFWAREWWEQSGGAELHKLLVQMTVRPRISHHGGETRKAVG